MEELKSLLIEKWPDILVILSSILSYFLIYLYRHRFNIAKNAMSLIFKENTQKITRESENAKENMTKELAEAKRMYNEAVSQYNDVKRQLDKVQNALRKMLEETEELYDAAEVSLDDRTGSEISKD